MEADRRFGDVATSVYAVSRERGVTLVASGLAFSLVNTLIPLLLFVLVGATTFDLLEWLVSIAAAVGDVDPDRILETTRSMLGDGAGRTRAAAIATVILGYSSFTTFQATNMAFGHVYGARRERSVRRTVANSLLALAAVACSLPLLAVVGVALAVLTDDIVVRLASVPLLFGALFGVFVPMYARFPEPAVTLREALPGAALAAVSWTVGAVGFRLYVVTAESVELYGVAGGVMVLLTWLYLGSLSLLVGVVLNAVLADRVDADDAWLAVD